jgi:BirA family transcriptional regulator, biotin operon repressor / biotin---[acetyl-CoA-carboxylase] ligase
MDQNHLESLSARLNLGGVRYYERTTSSNDQAAAWVEQGAPDLALVVAGEQTAGRGRAGRVWHSPAGASLSFSMVLLPRQQDPRILPRYTALGALAVTDALRQLYQLSAHIKWPNDVLVDRRKVCGVLAEARWQGSVLEAVILGIGINLGPAAVSQASLPPDRLLFPVSCLEDQLGRPVDPLDVLESVLISLKAWLPRLPMPDFLHAWDSRLAFRGEWVQVSPGESRGKDGLPRSLEKMPPDLQEGKVVGLAPDGSLRLLTRTGETVSVGIGEVRLRPVG